jgi:hypothetical protein
VIGRGELFPLFPLKEEMVKKMQIIFPIFPVSYKRITGRMGGLGREKYLSLL